MRPEWDDYFLGIMDAVSKRATCDRGRSGAVLVRDNHVLATGYVGAPRGIPDCDQVGHLMRHVVYEDGSEKDHCMRTAHAEANALAQAARHGVSTLGATMYCRMVPCLSCCQSMINAGVKRVVAQHPYQGGELSLNWFDVAGVEVHVVDDKELY